MSKVVYINAIKASRGPEVELHVLCLRIRRGQVRTAQIPDARLPR